MADRYDQRREGARHDTRHDAPYRETTYREAPYGRDRDPYAARGRPGFDVDPRDVPRDRDPYDQERRLGGAEYGYFGHGEFRRTDYEELEPGGRNHDEDRRRHAARSTTVVTDHRGRGPRSYRRSDERIAEDVNDRLTEDRHLDATDIAVTVRDGEVTLEGTVDDRGARRHAEDLAEAVVGVRHVQNNLRVQGR